MTSPGGGGDDKVIRAVYQAVADYSQLLRETRKAREQTKALKADIDAIAGTRPVQVKVTADTAAAKAELARVLRDVLVQVKVTVDAAAAKTELARVLRDATVKIKVSADTATAQTEIARVLRDVTVKVKLSIDAVAANTAVRRALAGVKAVVSVDADVTPLRRRVDAALARARAKLGVDVEQGAIVERMRALIGHLESLGPVVLAVEIDNKVLQALEASAARLKKVRDSLTAPAGGGPPPAGAPSVPSAPRGGGSGGGGGGGGGAGGIPGLDFLQGFAGVILKFVPLVAGAIPLVGALTAAVGTLGATVLALGAGVGIFAVGAIGAFTTVAAKVKDVDASAAPLEGSIGRVVQVFENLKDQYTALTKSTQQPIFDVFITALNIASTALTKVQPLIALMTGAFDQALKKVQAGLSGPGFDRFLEFVSRQGPAAITTFTTALGGIAGGVVNLLQQFEPFISTFLDGFAKLGTSFAGFSASLASNTGFQQFLAYSAAQVPAVIDLVTHLLGAAVNLGIALAPLGTLVLGVADGFARLIAALPPAVLTAIVVALVAVALAIKGIGVVSSVAEGLSKFQSALSSLPGRLGAAAAQAGALRVALIALGTAGGIALVVTGLVLLFQKLGQAQRDAAAAAKTHADEVRTLGGELAQTDGKVTDSIRAAKLDRLSNTQVEGTASKSFFGIGGSTVNASLTDIAGQAGISLTDLVAGSTGDQQKYSAAYAKLNDYAAAQQKAADTGVGADGSALDKEAQAQAAGTADAARKAADAYAALSPSLAEAQKTAKDTADAIKGLTSATGAAVPAAKNAVGAYDSQAAAYKDLKEQLKDSANPTEAETGVNNATSMMDAYDQALQAAADGQKQLTRAQRDSRDAMTAYSEAVKAAKANLLDLQRQLRDLPLNERQLQLNVKKSDEALRKAYATGASADDIAQAQIDNETAHNSLNDFEQDKTGKKADINKEIGKGVKGNQGVINAQRALDDARDNVTKLQASVKKLNEKAVDARIAFDGAAGAIGLTETGVRNLKKRMDDLKSKTIKVELDSKDAEDKLRALAIGQEAMKLQAAHPTWSLAKVYAEAAKQVPTYTDPKTDPSNGATVGPDKRYGGYADGGPTAGPVRGPGTGTSDSVFTVLPVGGPANLSDGEHIVTDREVKAAGGHAVIEAFRQALRAGQRWGPTVARYAYGGPALAALPGSPVPAGWAATVPRFAAGGPALPAMVPGYAAGGAVQAMSAGGAMATIDRSVTVNVGTITNAVPESAGASLYKQVRRAIDGGDL